MDHLNDIKQDCSRLLQTTETTSKPNVKELDFEDSNKQENQIPTGEKLLEKESNDKKIHFIEDHCKHKPLNTQEVKVQLTNGILDKISSADESKGTKVTRIDCATLTEDGDDAQSEQSECKYCNVRLEHLRFLERRKANQYKQVFFSNYAFQKKGVYRNKGCQTSPGWFYKAVMTLEEQQFLSILLRERSRRRKNRPESFCKCVYQGTEERCQCGEIDKDFEWVWDLVERTRATQLVDNDRLVVFHRDFSCGTGIIRGNQAMKKDQYFWEIKFTTPVYGTDMMTGFGTDAVDLKGHSSTFCSMLGWDAESWGISYDGRLQHEGQKRDFCTRFGQGTIIGVHLDMWRGTASFFKNRQALGTAFRGLRGRTLYPMACSTAARSGMKIISARSFPSSLQFLCCQKLRQCVPAYLDVSKVLPMPPGLKLYLANRLSWLVRPQCPEPRINPCLRATCQICLPFTDVLEGLKDCDESDEEGQDDFHILTISEDEESVDEDGGASVMEEHRGEGTSSRLQEVFDETEEYPFIVKRFRFNRRKSHLYKPENCPHESHSQVVTDEVNDPVESAGAKKEDCSETQDCPADGKEQTQSRKRKR